MGKFAAWGFAVAVAPALVLSGCAAAAPAPTATPRPTASPSPSASIDPASIEAKLILFDETNAQTITAGATGGRDFIDALVAAGFERNSMEVTADRTAIGLVADNIQFSVQIGDDCLVGQYGNVGYQSAILPALDSSGCLIGATRPIDW